MKKTKNAIKLLKSKIYSRLIRYFKSHLIELRFIDILEKNYKKNKSKFSVILVGANDGISHDFLYDFFKYRDVNGIAIEPIKDTFDDLRSNFNIFPNIKLVNKAVHPNSKRVIMYKVNPAKLKFLPCWANGIGSLFSDHHLKSGIEKENIIEEEVDADNLMNIIDESFFKNSDLDLLQIDTEGFDFIVLKMIAWDRFHPRIIKYEICNLQSNELKDSINLLKENGYYTFFEGNDMIALDLYKVLL